MNSEHDNLDLHNLDVQQTEETTQPVTEPQTPELDDMLVAVASPAIGFDSLGLSPAICAAVKEAGYTEPTAVQAQAIPAALAGRDLMVSSSTGSGKTAGFVLPSLERILAARGDNNKRREKGVVHGPRVLVLAPTRELALQVAKACEAYGRRIQGLRVATVVGGVPYGYQLKALRGPLDVLIATPGRLLDHISSGAAVLSNVEVLVLDEADRMLDMGFIDDIDAIAQATPAERQTLMFSATFAGHVGGLAKRLTRDPQRIDVASHTDTHENIEQRLYWVDHTGHRNDLLDHFLTDRDMDQAVVFTSTQIDADRLADRLAEMGHAVAALHGGMPQGRRNRVLQGLRQRHLRVLIATDVAARGIDVPTITHVINYGLPMKPEDYVHRIGRTGRAGRSGLAVTLAGRDDQFMVRRIERFTTQRIPVSTVAGLEPTKPAPTERPAGGKFGKPMPGQRHRAEGGFRPRREEGFAPRREEGFAPRRDEGFAPRREEGFAPRRDEGFAPRREEGYGARREGGFAPRRDEGFRPRPAGGREGFQGRDNSFQRDGGRGHGDQGGRPQGAREQRSYDENWFEPAAGREPRPAFQPRDGQRAPHGKSFHPGSKPQGFKPTGKPGFGGGFKPHKPAGPRRQKD